MNLSALVADGSLLVAIPIAVLAGVISFLSPCVLPLVPGYLGFIGGAVAPRADAGAQGGVEGQGVSSRSFLARSTTGDGVSSRSFLARSTTGDGVSTRSFLARGATGEGVSTRSFLAHGADGEAPRSLSERSESKRAEPGRGRLVLGVLLFIAGFTVVFVSMAMLGGTLGRFLLEYQDLLTRILGVVIIAMGLVFIGWFGLAQRIARPQVRGNLGLVGAPLLGIALGIGWAPCIGPTLAVILAMSFDSGSVGRAALLGVAYSLGLGIPFLLITLGFGWATRSVSFVRRHLRLINLIGGGVLVVLGLLMVTGVWTAIMAQLQGVFAGVPTPL